MKVLVCVLVLVAVAAAAKIPCSQLKCEDLCKNPPTPEDCKAQEKEYVADGSVCGCCAACIDYIPYLGACDLRLSTITPGYPVVARHCAPGSQCVDHKCLIIMQ